jgi:glycerol-3-phosphate dehydrogenase
VTQGTDTVYDVVVIGGGITGAGVARDAARRGLSVALVEERDFAWGTSSRSSKLIHGGLRYLEQYELGLVFESVSERRVLLDIAPHLVAPLGFLFPVFEGSRRSRWVIQAGMWVYEGLALFRSPHRPRSLAPGDVAAEEPALDREGLTGASLYWDCATNDARLTLETALDAAAHGALLRPRTRACALIRDGDGRVAGVEAEDVRTGYVTPLRGRTVVCATGPWTDATLPQARPAARPLLRPTKGVHIVVDASRLPLNHAVVCFHPTDGRVLFAIPWGPSTYIGTTDTDWSGDPEQVVADAGDVAYLLAAAQDHFPAWPLTRDDVRATWAGLRPLVAPPEAGVAASATSREHIVHVETDGLVVVAGGKLTTYRRMASEVVDTVVSLLRMGGGATRNLQPARTDEEPLPGAVGWPQDDDREGLAQAVAAEGGVSIDTARHLVGVYGTRAHDLCRRLDVPGAREPWALGRPEVLGMIDWSVQKEYALTVEDVLVRRTAVFYHDADQGLAVAPVVAQRMASLLGWEAAEREAQVEAYATTVARSRAWRGG